MNKALALFLIVLGFVFALISILIIPIIFIFNLKLTQFVNPIAPALLGILMGGILNFDKNKEVKKWVSKVIVANMIAPGVGIILIVVYVRFLIMS